jgi:LuxR family transcriptional regulator, maltose regulon positive regulatory protein
MTAMPRDAKVTALVPKDRAPVADRPAALSKAKLTPPRAPARLVAADRYRQWLEPVLSHDVTLVCAPLGHGKTVFAAQLYRDMLGAGLGAAWVSCYRSPAGRFADYLVEAIGAAVDGDWPGREGDPDAIAIDLANRIHSSGAPLLLCLDDIDQIAAGEDFEFLAQLIGHCPTNLHILATCRDERRLPPDLIEQRGAIQRVGVRVLRARDAEMADYLGSQGIPIGGGPMRALNEVLGGWWGALHRAAASLRSGGWSAGPDNWQQRCVQWVAPLFAETLAGMPERHRQLLTRCAVARTLTPDLATHLSGDILAGAVLRDIAQSGHFVEPLTAAQDQFVVHPALRAVLLAGAADVPGLVDTLRTKAIEWHVRAGDLDEAIAIAVASGDAEANAALLVRHGMDAIALCGPAGVREAIGRLSRVRIAKGGALALTAAWSSSLSGDEMFESDICHPRIDPAERAAIDEVRAIACGKGSVPPAIPLPAAGDFKERLLIALKAEAVLKAGDHRQVQAMLRPILRRGRTAGIGFVEAIALTTMADLHRAQGRPGDAERLVREGLTHLALGASRQSGTAAILAVALADIHYLRNDLISAGTLIDEFLPALTGVGLPGLILRGYRVAIRLAVASGRSDEALALIEAVEEIGADRDLPMLAALGAVERTRLHIPLVSGFDEILSAQAEEAAIAAPGSPGAQTFAILSEALAFDAIANLDRPRLTCVANRLLALGERVQDVEMRTIGTLMNVLPQLSGRCDRMLEIDTVKFLNRAASMGFVRSIVDLLEITGVRTSQDFDRAEYSAGSFLALLQLSHPPESETLGLPRASGSAFSFFTSREMEIVNALNEGETNKMIARKLGVTPETVKWHMKSLMRKLRATSREEVVSNTIVLGVSLTRDDE